MRGPTQCTQSFIKAYATLRNKPISAIRTSARISLARHRPHLTRQNNRPPPGRIPLPQQQRVRPRPHRAHPEPDSDLSPQSAVAYSNHDLTLQRQIPPHQHELPPTASERTFSPSDNDSNKQHETKSQQSHQTFDSSLQGAATPAKSIEATTPQTQQTQI
jgi:hypothetical protein